MDRRAKPMGIPFPERLDEESVGEQHRSLINGHRRLGSVGEVCWISTSSMEYCLMGEHSTGCVITSPG